MANMKQIGLGFRQYVDDYDSRFPGAGQWQKWGNGGHWVAGVNGSGVTGAPGALAAFTPPYTKTGVRANISGGAIFPYVKSEQIFVCPSSTDGQEKGLDYSMNCTLSGEAEFGVQNQTDVILLVDEDKPSDGFFYASTDVNSSDHLTKVHNGGGNLLFCDGHAKFYPNAVYPIDDNTLNGDAGDFKTRTTGQPRFFDSAGVGAGTGVFGSCTAP
jgi:prepilin-type processing-associated H-X9-DG protein